MSNELKSLFDIELRKSKSLINEARYDEAFIYLERAHIIGQTDVVLHTISHVYMLKVGFIKKDFKEVLGQLFRLPLGIIGSLFGIAPTGNTGGSNVSAFRKMEIPEDLRKIMKEAKNESK